MVTKTGNQKNNKLNGTSGDDLLLGLGGDDQIKGFAGDDVLRGGPGNDNTVRGGRGNDLIRGEGGNDVLWGDAGRDTVRGGGGNDTIKGDAEDDTLFGEGGDDRFIWNETNGSDTIDGGLGADVAEINYLGTVSLGQQGNKAIFERKGKNAFRLTLTKVEQVDVNGGQGQDRLTVKDLSNTAVSQVTFSGGDGNDTCDGGATSTALIIKGGAGSDLLTGGNSDDTISSGQDTDSVNGGAGSDRIIWNEGDGDDVIDAGADTDIVEENFSGNTVLQAVTDGKVSFGRIGPNPFTMTIDNAEQFEVNGESGNDSLTVNSLAGTDVTLVTFSGKAGNDAVDASATNTLLIAHGNAGDDQLTGGTGTSIAGNGTVTGDVLTGGAGKDQFRFVTDPFAGLPIQTLAQPDIITDYQIGQDQLVFAQTAFGLSALTVQVGASGGLSGDSTVLVLTDPFANAAAAAQAIAANDQITTSKGLFVYFNTTQGFSRVVYSTDLATGGTLSIIANLTNLTNAAQQANFSGADFQLV